MSNLIVSKNATEAYLEFIHSLDLPFTIQSITSIDNSPQDLGLSSCQAVISLVCTDSFNSTCEVEIRYAWEAEIWQQNYFDFNWDEKRLLSKRQISSNKLIIYLCESTTGLSVASKLETVPQKYVIYPHWQKLQHLYLLLPLSHPFGDLQQIKHNLSGYATTRSLTEAEPPLKTNSSSALETQLSLQPNNLEGGLRTVGLYKQNLPNKPLISIITVVYNGEKYLEQTIQSVINQAYDNVEYIVIDGGSTDKTLDILYKYDAQIDYWVSAPDKGIYDAMNKGTMLASGKYTLHVNADDLLYQPNSLNLNYSDTTMAGLVLIFHPEEQIFKKRLNRKIDSNEYINAIRYPFHHQGFIGLRNQHSLFNTNYKIIADNLLMAKKISTDTVSTLDNIISLHRREGVSAENNDAIDKELLKAISQSKNIKVYFTIYYKIFYSKLRSIAKALNLVTLKRKYL